MRVSLYLFAMMLAGIAASQALEKTDSIVFEEDITCLCQNIKGEIFFGLSSGAIIKTTKNGEQLEKFSYPNTGLPRHINCANPLKVFVFFENTQSYLFIDRFTVNPTIYSISENPAERVDYATLAADQSVWFVTSPSLFLKRKLQTQITDLYLLSSIFANGIKAQTLCAVGNTVVLQTEKKAYIFNLAGQLTDEIELENSTMLSVAGNRAYYLSNQRLKELSGAVKFDVKFPKAYSSGIALSSNEFLLIDKNSADFYFMR